jgi:hypothetical protein
MNKDLTRILTEEIDEETLFQMPLWFRILGDNYRKRHSVKRPSDSEK